MSSPSADILIGAAFGLGWMTPWFLGQLLVSAMWKAGSPTHRSWLESLYVTGIWPEWLMPKRFHP